jgi:hypothetical protein
VGFVIARSAPCSYAALVRGGATIGLNLNRNLPADHPVKIAGGERAGRGRKRRAFRCAAAGPQRE